MKDQLNYQQMPVIHQQVAGIDIGSKFHVVAVGDNPKTDVREFGVSTKALFELAQFLKENGIQHVAMAATGGYEKPLVSVLQQEGFAVVLLYWLLPERIRKTTVASSPTCRMPSTSVPCTS